MICIPCKGTGSGGLVDGNPCICQVCHGSGKVTTFHYEEELEEEKPPYKEITMETMLFAEAPAIVPFWLTGGKQYKVIAEDDNEFSILDDNGAMTFCSWAGDSQLPEEGAWKRIEVTIDKENEKLWDIVLSSKVQHPDDSDKIEILETQDKRYEAVRKLNPNQFTELYKMNISTGVHFDVLVDRLITGELKV